MVNVQPGDCLSPTSALAVKNLPANAGDVRDTGSVPGSGRSPRRGHGHPLQCSCLENSMDRGAWGATVHGVAKSWPQLNDYAQHSKAQHRWDQCNSFLGLISPLLEGKPC